ncbi:ATP-binding protein [Salinirubrum litoreum]|uniref:ATP-binding protein n=1 Tax=Salinirubrum litoreum TaxID=1126234 RepID=A0ABD5RED8_9EURY|nr:ATPase [Salinirubrum litoreum]
MHVLGRHTSGEPHPSTLPTGRLGRYRATDGSAGATVGVDLDRPHAGLVVGKRGYGKSYTLGVLAEAAARAEGVAPIVVDPMGVFAGLADDPTGGDPDSIGDPPPTDPASVDPVSAEVLTPAVAPSALPARAWPALLGLARDSPAGSLCQHVAGRAPPDATLAELAARAAASEATRSARRTVRNELRRADDWGVFGPDGLRAPDLLSASATVLDCSRLSDPALNAVVRAVAVGLYRHCVRESPARLPWLLLDEAHACFDGIAGPALETILTRGRAPGVSLVAATQRPSALPGVAHSQADLLVAHRLTATPDIDALEAVSPTYLRGSLGERLPTEPGTALVVDDTTESVHGVRIRERTTPHLGDSPRASHRRATVESDDDGQQTPDAGRHQRRRRVETTE